MRALPALVSAALVLMTAQIGRADSSDDKKAPVIRHTAIEVATEGAQVVISAEIRDDSGIFAPTLWYRFPGDDTYSSADLVYDGDRVYTAKVTASRPVEYWLEAYDELGNGPARSGTPEKPYRIRIEAPPAPANTLLAASPDVEKPTRSAPTEMSTAPKSSDATPTSALTLPSSSEADPFATETPTASLRTPVLSPPAPKESKGASPALTSKRPDDDLSADPARPKTASNSKRWWLIGSAGVVAAAGVGVLIYALSPNTVRQNVYSPTVTRP